jgi:hypothetical protein
MELLKLRPSASRARRGRIRNPVILVHRESRVVRKKYVGAGLKEQQFGRFGRQQST